MSEPVLTELALLPGTLIDFRFEVEELLGSGGMGTVFRAHDREHGQKVAIKILKSTNESALQLERFVREAALLSELRHPGIVTYVAHGISAEGWPFLAMEWLAGEDLSARLKRGALSISDTLILLEHAATALAVAHGHHIIHRDLKPSNLFLRAGQAEGVCIIDFGIARRAFGSQILTRTGAIVGTPEYMSPEQARGEREILPSSDVFALGCVLYECVTGVPPFLGARAVELLAKILYQEPVPPRTLRAEIPPEFQDLLLRMLAKDPWQRPQDGGAVLAALTALRGTGVDGEHKDEKRDSFAPQIVSDSAQRVLCLVVATQSHSIGGATATLEQAESRVPEFTSGLPWEPFWPVKDAEVMWLADGTLAVKIAERDTLVEQVECAAACALAIKQHWPSSQIVVTTANGIDAPMLPAGEVTERALRHFKRDRAGICLDAHSADLLFERFMVYQEGDTFVLHAQRPDLDRAAHSHQESLPFVGRQLEIDLVKTWLMGRLEAETAGAALVIASSGSGKSRLLRELLRAVSADQLCVDIYLGGKALDMLQSEQSTQRIHDECSRHPMLLIFDALQELDTETAQQIDTVMRECAANPLLVLGLGRPETKERFPFLWTERTQEFSLRPLRKSSSEALISKVLGSQATPRQVRQIVTRAAGNPRRLAMLLRAAQRQEDPPAAFVLDLQAQLLRLPPLSWRVLRAASLCGDAFAKSTLEQRLDDESPIRTAALDSALLVLIEAGIVNTMPMPIKGDSEDTQYSFTDPLFREAALRLLPGSIARRGH